MLWARRYRTACTYSDGQIRRHKGMARRARCLADVGRRMTGSEDHFPSAVSGHREVAAPVSKISKALMRLSVGSASSGSAAVSLTAPPLSWLISLRQRHYYSPAVSDERQPCAQDYFFSPGGVVRLAPSKYRCHACAMWAFTQCTLSILLLYNVKYSHSRSFPHGQLVKHAGSIDSPCFVLFVLRTVIAP